MLRSLCDSHQPTQKDSPRSKRCSFFWQHTDFDLDARFSLVISWYYDRVLRSKESCIGVMMSRLHDELFFGACVAATMGHVTRVCEVMWNG